MESNTLNEEKFPGNGRINYAPWILEFGQEYTYYISSPIMKNINKRTGIYELWN